MTGLIDIPTDTKYLAISSTPLTQAAVEQLERAWTGKDLRDANWLGRVVITHGVGDERFSHDVALGQLKTQRPNHGGRVFHELVAMRISDTDDQQQITLRALPLALLMF